MTQPIIDDLNRKRFDRWAGSFDRWNFAFRYCQNRLLKMLELKKGNALLDLGCGTGWAVCHAAGMLEGQGRFVGVDLSEKMIDKARENVRGLANTTFYVANAAALPLDSDGFDHVICTWSFHHHDKPESTLAEVHRVLKPGGKVWILDASAEDPLTRWIDRRQAQIEPGHVKMYSTREYREMFKKAGLTSVSDQTMLFYPIKLHRAEKSRREFP